MIAVRIFKYGGRRHLGFSKIRNFERSVLCRGPMCVIVPIFVKIGPMVAEISRFYGLFMDGQNTRVGYERNGERQIFDIAEKVLLLFNLTA